MSEQFLKEALQMAEETKIVGIHQVPYHPTTFTIIVEHPDLPKTPEGMPPLHFDGEGVLKIISTIERGLDE